MLTSVQGVCRKGRIQLTQNPKNISNETVVIVTFLDSKPIDLRTAGNLCRGLGKP